MLNFGFVGLSIAATASESRIVALFANTQFSNYVKIRFISQLVNSMSGVLQKLLNVLMAQQFQLLFLCCYLLIFL